MVAGEHDEEPEHEHGDRRHDLRDEGEGGEGNAVVANAGAQFHVVDRVGDHRRLYHQEDAEREPGQEDEHHHGDEVLVAEQEHPEVEHRTGDGTPQHQRPPRRASQQQRGEEGCEHQPHDDRRADEREVPLVAVCDNHEDGPTGLHDEPAEAQHRAEQHHQQWRVAEQRAKELPEREPRVFLRDGLLPDEEEREEVQSHAGDRRDEDRQRPPCGGGLRGEAESEGEPRHPEGGEPQRDGSEGAYPRDDRRARCAVAERGTDEPPQRHVAG